MARCVSCPLLPTLLRFQNHGKIPPQSRSDQLLATLLTVGPYHETLSATQRKCPTTSFTCMADDTYMNDTGEQVYKSFDIKDQTLSLTVTLHVLDWTVDSTAKPLH